MVPEAVEQGPEPVGFPRPRGDGPENKIFQRDHHAVPPPTRGWSRDQMAGCDGGDGSPAHAGMVPLLSFLAYIMRGFPRPRGDGPDLTGSIYAQTTVPPPTRGWSPRNIGWLSAGNGSPAHAGMVPVREPHRPVALRFPRPRGDGPIGQRGLCLPGEVPPPTRGWSQSPLCETVRVRGSPAHAGMVPPGNIAGSAAHWFPRPRGDGPATGHSDGRMVAVPPPTRGWSISTSVRAPIPSGSPAHAGMVPLLNNLSGLRARFPRPRGDGPCLQSPSASMQGVPPPTRGWSLKSRLSTPPGPGSPAHAGMVPWRKSRSLAWCRFPRPRGDGPLYPAPRDRSLPVPPPTRGWSLNYDNQLADYQGSPAHAGMVPPPTC